MGECAQNVRGDIAADFVVKAASLDDRAIDEELGDESCRIVFEAAVSLSAVCRASSGRPLQVLR